MNWIKDKIKKVLIGIGVIGIVSAGGIIEYDLSHITGLEMADKLNNASQEIRAEYVLEGASFKATPKNDPKDRIEVKVGGKDEFKPKIEIQRWDNEVNFSVELKETETGNPTLNFEGEKIKWSKGNIDVEYYPYEGGHKMVWFLKEKPATNKVEFTLQSKGLDFFYQPPLTQEFQNGYSEEFKEEIVVTETDVKDLEGNTLVHRPENVVGSYAVYHNGNPTNYVGGKLYRTGKVGHIYRPRLYDSNGWEVWGDLFIDAEQGIYRITIDQTFLDTAKYPIKCE